VALKIASLCLLLLLLPACEILYPPPATWFLFPVAEFSNNSLEAPDSDVLIEGQEEFLQNYTVGVLRNQYRGGWNSLVEGDLVDDRPDENVLFAEFLQDEELFRDVVLLDGFGEADVDFIVSCSVDCIYSIDLDGGMYFFNWLTLGIGFLLGWPHQNPSAFYVMEAVIYDNQGEAPYVTASTLALNHKEWYCDNIYWRPSFYAAYALEPLFEQVLYDFLAHSGCLAK
jgi:hypothetical protein